MKRNDNRILTTHTGSLPRRLGMAEKTVANHKIGIFQKLRVRTSAQAISVAIRHGIVPSTNGGAA